MSADLLPPSRNPQPPVSNSCFLTGPNVTEVETEAATIKFFAPAAGDTSSSDSEDEEVTSSSYPNGINNRPSHSADISNTKLSSCDLNAADGATSVGLENDQSYPHNNNNGIITEQNDKQVNEFVQKDIKNHSLTFDDSKKVNTCSSNAVNEEAKYDESYEEKLADMRSKRFNPFDNDVHVTEDHFSHEQSTSSGVQPNVNDFPKSQRVRQYSFSSNTSDTWSDTPLPGTSADDVISNAELGLAEDHFSQPEGCFGLSSTEELEMAIANCKRLILECPDKTDRKRNLVFKLVQLRMKLVEAKEGPVEEDPGVKSVLGHKLIHRDNSNSKHYCEKCNAVIWGVLQAWYKCKECGYCCHAKCLNSVTRTCASVKVAENPSYILSICPEKGLAAQKYRCAECKTPLSNNSGAAEPRQCDYNGCYYCDICHWNDLTAIPARILHNWDFEPRKVCRASKQFLKLMFKKSVIRIQDINPMLFSFVEELNEVKKLREEILIMKKYFLSCQAALSSKLLLQLTDRQHFVENSDMYSVRDLLDTRMDDLLPLLAKIHSSFAQHIKTDCKLCQAKGFMCELCDVQEVLFPFDNIAIVCAQCSTVLHRHCFVKRQNRCPKCERRMQREASQK